MSEIVPHGDGIVSLIREAMASDKTPEYLKQLLDVRREWEADEARKAFNIAISEFQRRAPVVQKLDKAHEKMYAKMDRIWREIRPLLTELGLSVTWQLSTLQDSMCHVEGQLRHRDGHGEKLVYDLPLPELIRGQNRAQQAGSATTYAKRYALCGALGIVTSDDADDDGYRAGTDFVKTEQADELAELIEACRGLDNWNERAFAGYAGAERAAEIESSRYADVKAMLKKKLGQK